MDIFGAIEGLVSTLVDAGLSASPDNQGLNPPCVYVHPGDITPLTLDGTYTMSAQVSLIAPNTSQKGNLVALNEMLDLVLTVLEPDGPIDTQGVASVNNKNLPAFSFPVNLDL